MKDLLASNAFSLDRLPADTVLIGDDVTITSITKSNAKLNIPVKTERAAIAICATGRLRVKINLQEHIIDGPMLATCMPGHIIEIMEVSSDFKSHLVILSKRMLDIINIPGWKQMYLSLFNNPTCAMSNEQIEAMTVFYTILHRAASEVDNPFRLQVVENLIRVFYYGRLGQNNRVKPAVTYKNKIVEQFMDLVRTHFREERLIGFYADSLCITPKYLSKIVKQNTGRSAGEWIESHVILEARTMLQSSDMTIQQIATALNFPNQSFFGKYFKRIMGISPKQYRRSK